MTENIQFNDKSHSFTVIGGGITGLFTTWRLCQRGFKVTLLEYQKFLGGLSTSIKHDDYLLDIGPHELLFPKNMSQSEEIKQLMGKENIFEISDNRKYLFEGKLFSSNPSLYQVIFQFGIKFFLQSTKDFVSSRIKNLFTRSFQTSEDYLVGTYGKFLYETWFTPYLLRQFKTTDVSIKQIKDTFESPTLKSILSFPLSKFQKQPSRKISKISDVEYHNWYFKYGMGSFVEKIKQDIINLGGNIITDADIKSIQHNLSPKVINFEKKGELVKISTNSIIYCTPLSVTCKWFNEIPKNTFLEIENPKFLNSIMVFLFVDDPSLFDAWIINSFNPKLVFFRISQQTRLSKFVAPKNKSLICVEIRISNDDPLWEANDDFIFKRTIDDLKISKILNNQTIDGFKILKLMNIYPVATKSIEDLKTEKSITELLESYNDEYLLSAIEADGGRIASANLAFKYESKIRETGIFRAIVNAEKLFKKILDNSVGDF
jgi:protoporphyrinogen oxidase